MSKQRQVALFVVHSFFFFFFFAALVSSFPPANRIKDLDLGTLPKFYPRFRSASRKVLLYFTVQVDPWLLGS
jgi:hypothetical protein